MLWFFTIEKVKTPQKHAEKFLEVYGKNAVSERTIKEWSCKVLYQKMHDKILRNYQRLRGFQSQRYITI